MNHIEIKYSYIAQKPETKIDGEQANPYGELASILVRPFLDSASQIITCLDNEIFDDYRIDLYATVFQYEVLREFAKESEYCKEIHFHQIETLYSKAKLVKALSDICVQNGIPFTNMLPAKVYCSDSQLFTSLPEGVVYTNVPRADIGVFNPGEPIAPEVKIPVYFSDHFSATRENGRIIFGIPQSCFAQFLDFYLFEYVDRPAILECLTALRYVNLSGVQQVELDAIKTSVPAYYIGPLPSALDQGEKVAIDFFSFPDGLFALQIEDFDKIVFENSYLYAKNPGATNIEVIKNGVDIVASKPICVIGHQYAQEIRLIPCFEYLMRNQKNRIDVLVTPANSEDANKLVWKSSNPDVLQVNDDGSVTAFENGKVTITASGHSVSSSICVEVKPGLQGIRFSSSSLTVKTGDTVILECDVSPSGAPTENFVWDLDNGTIATINPSRYGNKCRITASSNYEGKGNIRCYDPVSKLGAICNLEVVSKEKATTAGKIALSCWMAGILIPVVLPASIIASIYGLTCDPEVAHRKRYIVCAIGSIITLLFWIFTAL